MDFIILGAGHGRPNLNNHLSSIYVENQGSKLLLDCGEGTSWQLLKHNLNHDALDAIIISHYHPDHIAGIFMVLQMFYLENRTKPLMLFVPERPSDLLDAIHLFYTFEQRFPFSLKVHIMDELELYYPEITPVQNDHLSGYTQFVNSMKYPNMLMAYSFLIEDNERSLVYTSDLETTNDIKHLFDKCHTLIIDAMHPDPNFIIDTQNHSVERIILTHGISSELDNWLKNNPTHRFEFAKEDIKYSL